MARKKAKVNDWITRKDKIDTKNETINKIPNDAKNGTQRLDNLSNGTDDKEESNSKRSKRGSVTSTGSNSTVMNKCNII